MTPRQLLGKARVHTFEYVPYLASYIYALREQETPGIKTAAVDDKGTLYWCPEYITKIGTETAAYVITHEVLHLIFDHHARSVEMLGENMTETERYICNVAADLVIEQTLSIMRDIRPKGAVHLGAHVPRLGITLDFPPNKSMQEYYRLITERLKNNSDDNQGGSNGGDSNESQESSASDSNNSGEDGDSGQDHGAGDGGEQDEKDDDGTQADGQEDASGDGAGSPSGGPSEDTPEPCGPGTGGSCADGQRRDYEVEGDGSWELYGEDFAAEAAEKAIADCEKSRPGSVPGSIKQAIRRKLRPQPDPFDQLRSAVCSSVACPVGGRDFTHRRRSRKQPQGDDQPLLHGRITVQPHAVIIVDTSSSMMKQDIQARALSVIGQGLRKLSRVRVFCADTAIQSNQMVASTRLFDWHGGGGTDMATAVDEVDRTLKPDSIVLVTDAETYWRPGHRPRARVVLAYTGKIGSQWHQAIPKWARVVPLNMEEE